MSVDKILSDLNSVTITLIFVGFSLCTLVSHL